MYISAFNKIKIQRVHGVGEFCSIRTWYGVNLLITALFFSWFCAWNREFHAFFYGNIWETLYFFNGSVYNVNTNKNGVMTMQSVVKRFQELTVDELYAILRLRAAVFVVEQNCVYQDIDDVDQEAWHVYLQDGEEIVGYARVIEKGKRLDEVSIGRVISLYRRKGIGTMLMELAKTVAKEKFSATKIKIGAQVQAQHFYEQAGFKQISEQYLEDGIPHVYMIYEEK